MFTGIVEEQGIVKSLRKESENLHLCLSCSFVSELKIDQSLSHNGVCLTVVSIGENDYTVTAISETLKKTTLGKLVPGNRVNLERCLRLGDRLDGHLVQGHVDQTALCTQIRNQNGSWLFEFEYKPNSHGHVTVEKGSVCVNGVSLTVVDSKDEGFSVAIIPYTWEHTNFNALKPGQEVNVEFDILGKYAARMLSGVNYSK
ncbi:MAG TPA: riboflavin synthase [Bacteroidia bacterium]|jgi:riboflavin synthase|nr:riboflavin synthase [Bacteroidia bacterium]